MKTKITPQQRLSYKTYLHSLIARLKTHYSLSAVEAEVLSRDLVTEWSARQWPQALNDGQVLYHAVQKEEPAGKPLKACRMVPVKLTLFSVDDLASESLSERRLRVLGRISWEALEQGACLTIEDLTLIMGLSERTIRRLIRHFDDNDVIIPLRGRYRDIGPGVSHKTQAILLLLKGLQPTEIARRLAHSLESIERYIRDFCTVLLGLRDGMTPARIARTTRLSPGLVKQYAELYQQAQQTPEFEPTLRMLEQRLSHLLSRSKKNFTLEIGDDQTSSTTEG
jgi:hypothetical protein